MRETVLKALEGCRQAVWNKIVVNIQRIMRGHFARRAMAAVRILRPSLADVVEAVQEKNEQQGTAP